MAYDPLPLNNVGRVMVSTLPADISLVTGNITTTQPVISTPVAGGTVVADVSKASNLNIFCSGTFSTVNCTFEGSLEDTGDTNWFGIQAVRTNANTIELTTGNLSAQPAYAWELSVNALSRFRVRATARTSGTQVWNMKLGSYATEPIPAIQTHPITGTVTATVASTSIAALATVVGQVLFRDVALSNTDVTVKASAGRVYSYYFKNPHATDTAWVHFYNALIASVTVGTTVPVWSVEVPAGGTNEVEFTVPLSFATGITIAATTSSTHTVSTAPTTALIAFVGYI